MSDTATGNRLSLVDAAEQALRDWLAPGLHREGDRLPPEQEVAAMLGVSRGTLRAALQRLEETGEILRHQGSGTFVGRMEAPTTFGERLEAYPSVAMRRGLRVSAAEIKIEQRAVGGKAGEALGLDKSVAATTISYALMANDDPVAVVFEVLHPGLDGPGDGHLRASVERGEMVLDVLIGLGVTVVFARTRICPVLLTTRERAGKLLGVQQATAALVLEELIFAARDEPVAFSRQVFAPGEIEVMVTRSRDTSRPARVAEGRSGEGSRAKGAGA
jgi:GntR family transcriptional regulator